MVRTLHNFFLIRCTFVFVCFCFLFLFVFFFFFFVFFFFFATHILTNFGCRPLLAGGGTTQAITIQATIKYPLFYPRENSRQNGDTNQATALQNTKLFLLFRLLTKPPTMKYFQEIGFCISHLLCRSKLKQLKNNNFLSLYFNNIIRFIDCFLSSSKMFILKS